MTKKHYEAIARILRDCIALNNANGKDSRDVLYIAKHLVIYFAQDNPKFDRVRFLTACGIEQHKHTWVRVPGECGVYTCQYNDNGVQVGCGQYKKH